jgi:glutathione reductase (NADPH)
MESAAVPPVTDDGNNHFDLIVIGAGSGGVSCAERAVGYGARVAVFEGGAYGGTCVNVGKFDEIRSASDIVSGCVPKKIMYNAAHVAETLDDASEYGFSKSALPR